MGVSLMLALKDISPIVYCHSTKTTNGRMTHVVSNLTLRNDRTFKMLVHLLPILLPSPMMSCPISLAMTPVLFRSHFLLRMTLKTKYRVRQISSRWVVQRAVSIIAAVIPVEMTGCLSPAITSNCVWCVCDYLRVKLLQFDFYEGAAAVWGPRDFW